MEYAPSPADRVARSTVPHAVERSATEMVDVICNPPEGWKGRPREEGERKRSEPEASHEVDGRSAR